MKKLFTLGAFLLASASVFAGSGKAIVPSISFFRNSSTQFNYTVITVSNITNHAVAVTVNIYDSAGNLVPSSWVSFNNFTASNTQIAAKSTGDLNIQIPSGSTGANAYGFAVIEWTNLSGDNDTVALVSHAYAGYLFSTANRESAWSIPVNSGQPY